MTRLWPGVLLVGLSSCSCSTQPPADDRDTGFCAPVTCAALGFQCGAFDDGCGGTLACGTCSAPSICGGGGTPNLCGCESDTAFAKRLDKVCGSVTDLDNCEVSRTVVLGGCATGEVCVDGACQADCSIKDGGCGYPPDHPGTSIGDTVEDIVLYGYPMGSAKDASNTWRPVRLSDFYDPQGNKGPSGAANKLLLVDLGAPWCSTCASEAETLKSLCRSYAAKGLVCYTALTQNQDGSDPVRADVDSWLSDHDLEFATCADNGSWNSYFRQEFIPLNLFIDLRTMRIIDRKYGFPPNLDFLLDEYTRCPSAVCPSGKFCASDGICRGVDGGGQ